MIPSLVILAQTTPAVSMSWDAFTGILLSLTTLGVLWTARTVFSLRDNVRDLMGEVGIDGKNGLKRKYADIDCRLSNIESRNDRIDAIVANERDQWKGDERREDLRRERDSLLPQIPPVNKPPNRTAYRDTHRIDDK